MSSLTSRDFWKATTERAIRTAAQAAVAMLIADATDLFTTDWLGLLSVVVMATLLSVLTSVGAGSAGKGPSLAGPETTGQPEPRHAATPTDAEDR